jgi:hypothetical protein
MISRVQGLGRQPAAVSLTGTSIEDIGKGLEVIRVFCFFFSKKEESSFVLRKRSKKTFISWCCGAMRASWTGLVFDLKCDLAAKN